MFALLPRGRAWQTNEGGPQKGWEPAFDVGSFDSGAFSTTRSKFSVLWRYWAAAAREFWFVAKRLCDLRMEFWCATRNETDDLWMTEYGLPDACDPFPDLCTKVAAIGGTRCEYYQYIAQRAGWSIECTFGGWCNTLPGSSRAQAGRFRPGRRNGALLFIRVHLGDSPAYAGPLHPVTKAGRMKAGRRIGCDPDISPLECLLARVVHAEIQITYEVTAA